MASSSPNSDVFPPENLPEWLHWLESCPSTNSWTLDRLSDLKHGDVVFTPRQTAGRGQQGRIWYSPPGVLTASFVLDLVSTAQLCGFSLAVGLAVVYAVEDLIPDLQNKLRLKWPNDVLLDGRKLAGILCEGATLGTTNQTRVVVGIGLNRCADFAQLELDGKAIGNPISLHQVASAVPDTLLLLEQIRHYLLQTVGLLRSQHLQGEIGFAALLPALRCRDALLGNSITIHVLRNGATEQISGQAVGIDDRGCLLLLLPNQVLRAFASGHVQLI
jgi:BirA family biotin operon repressor/biotin-[acetyl-CoA-carboxylase] ligase